MGRDWYESKKHPIALLRALNALRSPWVIANIDTPGLKILDIGSGAGFLSNALSLKGHKVTGIDLSQKSLDLAKQFDPTKTVDYLYADANSLPFDDHMYDVVCAMDIVQHVDNPRQLIEEASRVLKPGGKLFFHTFNRNFLSYLAIIKGINWFVKNTPPNMHLYSHLRKPREMEKLCFLNRLKITSWKGVRPTFNKSFWRVIWKGEIDPNFHFKFSRTKLVGYCAIAQKR